MDDQVGFMKFVSPPPQPNKQRDVQEPCTNSRRSLQHELAGLGRQALVGSRLGRLVVV